VALEFSGPKVVREEINMSQADILFIVGWVSCLACGITYIFKHSYLSNEFRDLLGQQEAKINRFYALLSIELDQTKKDLQVLQRDMRVLREELTKSVMFTSDE